MFTIFHGFHLVEEYHQWKKESRKGKNPLPIKSIKLLIAIAVPLFLWLAPSSLYGLPDTLSSTGCSRFLFLPH